MSALSRYSFALVRSTRSALFADALGFLSEGPSYRRDSVAMLSDRLRDLRDGYAFCRECKLSPARLAVLARYGKHLAARVDGDLNVPYPRVVGYRVEATIQSVLK